MDISQGYEEATQKVLKEYVQKKALPALSVPISRISNTTMAQEILSTYNNYDTAVDMMVEQGQVKSKAELERMINRNINSDFRELNLVGGANYRESEAMQLGMREAIRMLTVQRVAAGKGSVSIRTATKEAIEDFKKEFTVASSGLSSVVLDRKYAQQHNIEYDNMDDVVKSMEKLEHIDRLGIKLDYNELYDKFQSNAYLVSQLEPIIREKDPEVQKEMFLDRLGDNLIVDSDPVNPNVAMVYIKDDKLRKIPLPVPSTEVPFAEGQGPLKALRIDVGTYAAEKAKGDIEAKDKFYADMRTSVSKIFEAKNPIERQAAQAAYIKAKNENMGRKLFDGMKKVGTLHVNIATGIATAIPKLVGKGAQYLAEEGNSLENERNYKKIFQKIQNDTGATKANKERARQLEEIWKSITVDSRVNEAKVKSLINSAVKKAKDQDMSEILPDTIGAYLSGVGVLPHDAMLEVLLWAKSVGVKAKK